MKKLKVLDLFCGMGGWSNGFAFEGFECVGVDIVNVGYPYQLILADVQTLGNGERFNDFDVIVGSPPCRDFSKTINFGYKKWKDKPNQDKGLELVNAFLGIIEEAKPKFWIMENVLGLCKYVSPPDIKAYITKTRQRCFWGNFPNVIIPVVLSKNLNQVTGKHRSWKRAIIPTPVSQAFAKAIKQELKT